MNVQQIITEYEKEYSETKTDQRAAKEPLGIVVHSQFGPLFLIHIPLQERDSQLTEI